MSLHAGEGAAWGLPLKGKCKAVELAAYWPCLRAYLESRANETARVVVVSTAGRADLPGADDAPVPDVAYLADRPPPPCFPASCWFLCLRPPVAVPSPRSRCLRRAPEDAIDAGPDDSATTRDILPYHTPSMRSNPSTLCTQAGDAAVERARRCDRARFGRDGVGDGHLLLAGLVDGPARRGARARGRPPLRGVFCRVLLSFSICCSRDLRRRPLARSLLRSRARGPPTREIPPRRHRRDLTSSRTHAGAEPREGLRGRGRRMPPAEEPQAGRRRVYGVVAVVASELTQVTTL